MGNTGSAELFVAYLEEPFFKNDHPRFRREFAANRHMPYGTAAAYAEGVRNANMEKMARLVKITGCCFRRRSTCFGENLELTSARLPLLRLWASLSSGEISLVKRLV